MSPIVSGDVVNTASQMGEQFSFYIIISVTLHILFRVILGIYFPHQSSV